LDYTFYGEYTDAETYFSNRLHATAWEYATRSEREKALIEATQIVDSLNYKGWKGTVYDILFDDNGKPVTPPPSSEELKAAYDAQVREFPRNTDTTVPDNILMAVWEITYQLLDGVDVDLELENLDVTSQGIASVRTTYDRRHVSIEHLYNGVPSLKAWRFLYPYLRDVKHIKISRV
jgi:hypothetical protein